MSLWSRLFGERETAVQKLARARTHLEEGEATLAINTVEQIEGPEADEIRRRAREMASPPEPAPAPPPRAAVTPPPPEGGMTVQFNPDGSTTIGAGPSKVTLNAPVSDDDGRTRSTDALDVARRLLVATSTQPLDSRAFAFVDAAVVLARAGEAAPLVRDPQRRALVELVRAASTRDPAAVVANLRSCAPDILAGVAQFATPLAVRFAARELAELVLERRLLLSLSLLKELVRIDPELCMRLVEQEKEQRFAAETLLLAEDSNVEIPALAAKWDDWLAAAGDDAAWQALEIRRLARRDLDAALVRAGELGPYYAVDRTLATHLAKTDPARAIAVARDKDPHVDHAGWIEGLAGTRIAGVGELVDAWVGALDRLTYDPWAYFVSVLRACIELGDLDRTRRCIAAGGPTGWQIACAAYHTIALAPDAGARAAMLAVCYERVKPAVVAGRAIAYGSIPFGAGKVVFQPEWLAFRDPHPLEALALPVALGHDAPLWD